MAEKKSLEEEISTLKDNTSEKEKTYFKDLQDLKEKQASTNQEQVTKRQAEEVGQGLRTELDKVKEDKTRKQEKYALTDLPNLEVLTDSEGKKKNKLSA
ncbi:hypothetical protein VZT92_010110 [Zoarces viviparus]